MSTPYSLMNFDNNRQRAELIVRFDTISYAHLHKDVAADIASAVSLERMLVRFWA